MSNSIKIIKYSEIDSTNAEAKRLAAEGGAEGCTVIMAERQTAGRGRGSRKWLNTEGALLMTILTEHKGQPDELPLLGFAAAMAVKTALGRLTDGTLNLSVKWPNDVITEPEKRKLCGILSESFSMDNRVFAAVGIGVDLNCESIPQGLLQPASSVYMETGIKLDPETAAADIAAEYLRLTERLSKSRKDFLDLYEKSCETMGLVAVTTGRAAEPAEAEDGQTRFGTAMEIAKDGGLIVEFEDGSRQTVYAADVSVRSSSYIDEQSASALLPKRKRNSNKGDNGRAALIAGSPGMAGAAVMCTAAAIRAGAGLTKALIPEGLVPSFAALPEAILVTGDDLASELASWATAIGIGCGMGVSQRTAALLKTVLLSGKPCVIDADGLNTMSKHRELLELLHENCVLTPHPAEMSRLMGCDTAAVLADFTGTALRLAKAHGCTVLLKSARSVIASPEGSIRYNAAGNSGLAKGGSGDVLTGIITSMLAQGASPFDAASIGSYLLGCSADKALELLAERFITATDVVSAIGISLDNALKNN